MKRNESFIMKNVGGENLLIPVGSKVLDMNGLITLNETASYVWDLLSEEKTVGDLANAVAIKFNIDNEIALHDVKCFLNEIESLSLLEQ